MADNHTLSDVDLITEAATEIQQALSSLKTRITFLQTSVRKLERRAKAAARRGKRKTAPKRGPTGFARPTKVSAELCTFMSRPEGTLVARTEATRAVNAYIKEKGLQSAHDAQVIKPDAKLRGLLEPIDEKGLTYFTLQKHMNRHFNPGSHAASA